MTSPTINNSAPKVGTLLNVTNTLAKTSVYLCAVGAVSRVVGTVFKRPNWIVDNAVVSNLIKKAPAFIGKTVNACGHASNKQLALASVASGVFAFITAEAVARKVTNDKGHSWAYKKVASWLKYADSFIPRST